MIQGFIPGRPAMLVALVGLSSACQAAPNAPSVAAAPEPPSGAYGTAAVQARNYRGTMTLRYQRIENLSPGRYGAATYPIVVEVKEPVAAPAPSTRVAESNPFSLSIYLPSEQLTRPGVLRLHSANVRQIRGEVTRFVTQDWTYTLNGNSFSGSLTSPLNPVQTSWITTEETGGPLPTCLAYMWQGSRLSGRFAGNRLLLEVSGRAGTAYSAERGIVWGGGTCAMGAVVRFTATIDARR